MLNAVFHEAIQLLCLFARRAKGKVALGDFGGVLFIPPLHLFPYSEGPYALCFICLMLQSKSMIQPYLQRKHESCGENVTYFLQVPNHTSF